MAMPEMSQLTNPEMSDLAGADTLSSLDLLGVMQGTLQGYEWTDGQDKVFYQIALDPRDPNHQEALSKTSSAILNDYHECQLRGEITPAEARTQQRVELWRAWQNLYKKD